MKIKFQQVPMSMWISDVIVYLQDMVVVVPTLRLYWGTGEIH